MGAPYDKRNEADYEDISGRIRTTLFEMAQDPAIPVTEKELARRAECSRGTLRNRGWPLTELKKIKRQRKDGASNKTGRVTPEHRSNVDKHIEDKKQLLQQLHSCRNELAVWVDKNKELEDDKKKLTRSNAVLQKAKEALERRVTELVLEKSELRKRLDEEQAKRVVVPLKKPPRSSKTSATKTNEQKKKNNS